MKRYRHTVEQIRGEGAASFDQQFWPVVIAIVVLCSIAAGAIATLTQGPWMWGSLLVLPAAAALAIFLLYRLDDSFLRRSLQLAILTSLAIHLLVLIFTSLTYIFGTTLPQKEIMVARTPERRVVISNRNQQFVFQETAKHEVQDQQEPEPQKRTTTREQVRPQPIPVVKKTKAVDPQVTKRQTPQSSIPRLAKMQSKLSRNTNAKPTSVPIPTVAHSQPVQKPRPTSTTAPSTTELTRQHKSDSKASKSSANQPKVNRSLQAQASRRTTRSQNVQQQTNIATARIRKSTPRIPKIAEQKSPSTRSNRSLEAAQTIRKSETSVAVQRRVQPNQTVSQKNTQPQLARSATSKPLVTTRRNERRVQVNPTASPSRLQRQSIARSPTPTSNPSTIPDAASSNQSRLTPKPKNVAVSRATTGKMGSGRSSNLERAIGGQPSPVRIASNASSKRQSSRLSENFAMTSSQRSTNLERGRASVSKRVLRSQTSAVATKSGSASPAEITAQAASASVDAAASAERSSRAAEKGSSMLDIGATKVVTETFADRRGGGGSPQISTTMAQDTARQSGRRSNQVPNVASQVSSAITGPTAPAESTQVSAEPGRASAQIARTSNPQPGQGKAGKSERPNDAVASVSNTTATGNLAAARRKSEEGTLESGSMAELSGEPTSQGNDRTRIAYAPRIQRSVNFGMEGTEAVEVANVADDGDDFSTTKLMKRATDSLTGGSVISTASKVAASSMAGLPLFTNGKTENDRRDDRDFEIDRESQSSSSQSRSRTGTALSPTASSIVAREPGSASSTEVAATDSSALELQRQGSKTSMRQPENHVEIAASEGVGGLGTTVSRRAGTTADAITESGNVSPLNDSRFKRRDFGGVPSINSNATIAKQAFRGRSPSNLSDAGPQTEKAIELGLEFLARCQLSDGSWTLGQFDDDNPYFQNQLDSDAAATGLVLLAFQGAGYNHREFKYASQINRAVDWLVSRQRDDGCLYVPADQKSNEACLMYSHAIAALALAEAYGMTQDAAIGEPAQRALDYIAETQHPRKGGWRYFAQRRKRSTDTSVTGWMMMALKSGQLAGLEVAPETLRGIENWLKVAEVPNSKSEFRYNPYAADSEGRSRSHGKRASVTMTSVGLLMRVYSGWGPNDPRFLQGAEQLLKQMPGDSDSIKRDTYYWYYATQVMKHAGGDLWQQWSQTLHPLLVGTQEQSGELRGSWHPYKPVPDRWGPQGGRIYVTTMNLLSLEVRYRLLPLYENTIQSDE